MYFVDHDELIQESSQVMLSSKSNYHRYKDVVPRLASPGRPAGETQNQQNGNLAGEAAGGFLLTKLTDLERKRPAPYSYVPGAHLRYYQGGRRRQKEIMGAKQK